MVSFGNASGPVKNIDQESMKLIASKSLYYTRPALNDYISNRQELVIAAAEIFRKLIAGEIKIDIYKRYKLEQTSQAHKDLEARKIIGPAILIP